MKTHKLYVTDREIEFLLFIIQESEQNILLSISEEERNNDHVIESFELHTSIENKLTSIRELPEHNNLSSDYDPDYEEYLMSDSYEADVKIEAWDWLKNE